MKTREERELVARLKEVETYWLDTVEQVNKQRLKLIDEVNELKDRLAKMSKVNE